MRTISADEITEAMREALSGYTERLPAGMEKTAEAIAKETKADLKQDSPVKTGDYKKGWSMTKKGRTSYKAFQASDGSFHITVYNKQGRLTHLLENPHEIVHHDGTRTGRYTKPNPHIQKNKLKGIAKYEAACKKLAENP